MQPQNNLVTEIILGVVAGLLVIGSVLLLYAGKIDFSGALAAWGIAAGVVGIKLALNAPSPSQQVQLNAQQQNLQQLVSYALGLVQSLSQPQAPVAPPQPVQTALPNVGVASGQVAHVLATPPEVTLTPTPPNSSVVSNPGGTGTVSTLTPPTQAQFKQPIQIPDVSMPLAAVGQGIPLGQ